MIKKRRRWLPSNIWIESNTWDKPPPLAINIAQLVKIVNNSDLLRYIPNELLSVNQIKIKNKALNRYNIKKKIQIGKKE